MWWSQSHISPHSPTVTAAARWFEAGSMNVNCDALRPAGGEQPYLFCLVSQQEQAQNVFKRVSISSLSAVYCCHLFSSNMLTLYISAFFQFLFHYSKAHNSVGAVQHEVSRKITQSSGRLLLLVHFVWRSTVYQVFTELGIICEQMWSMEQLAIRH